MTDSSPTPDYEPVPPKLNTHDRLFEIRKRIDSGEFGNIELDGFRTGKFDGPVQAIVRNRATLVCRFINFWWIDGMDRPERPSNDI